MSPTDHYLANCLSYSARTMPYIVLRHLEYKITRLSWKRKWLPRLSHLTLTCFYYLRNSPPLFCSWLVLNIVLLMYIHYYHFLAHGCSPHGGKVGTKSIALWFKVNSAGMKKSTFWNGRLGPGFSQYILYIWFALKLIVGSGPRHKSCREFPLRQSEFKTLLQNEVLEGFLLCCLFSLFMQIPKPYLGYYNVLK